MIDRYRLATLLGLSLSLAVSGTAMAANSFSRNGRQDVPPSASQSLLPPGPASITQSTSNTVTVGSAVSCNGGAPAFLHTDNSYFRGFTLSAFNPPLDATQFMVQQVTFGIEQSNASGTGTTQPIVAAPVRQQREPAHERDDRRGHQHREPERARPGIDAVHRHARDAAGPAERLGHPGRGGLHSQRSGPGPQLLHRRQRRRAVGSQLHPRDVAAASPRSRTWLESASPTCTPS